jgi:hypothetical protein
MVAFDYDVANKSILIINQEGCHQQPAGDG